MGDGQTTLILAGELDIACQADLAALLLRLEATSRVLVVDLAAVTYADSHGLLPLFDDARRRRDARLPALLLSGPSVFLARVLGLLGAQRVVDTERLELPEHAGPPAAWYAC